MSRRVGLRFWRCPTGRAPPHGRPVEPILQRRKTHPERRPNANANERKAREPGGPVALLLEYDRVRRKECVQYGVRNRDVYGEEEDNRLCHEEHCSECVRCLGGEGNRIEGHVQKGRARLARQYAPRSRGRVMSKRET